MDISKIVKTFAGEAAKNVADKATGVIDTNRSQLVTDFEEAVARQRVELILDAETRFRRIADDLTSGIRTALLTAASIISVALLVLSAVHLLHR